MTVSLTVKLDYGGDLQNQITHCKLVFIDSHIISMCNVVLVNSVICIRLITHRNNTI